MTSEFAAAHDELRAVARDLLPKVAGADAAWSRFAAAGWLGLEVPAPLGGAGATFAEVAVVLEEMGRAATPGPFLGTVALGVGALGLAAPCDARGALLGAVASGDARVAVALDGQVSEEACPPNLVPTASTTAAGAMGDALCMTLLVETVGGDYEVYFGGGDIDSNGFLLSNTTVFGGAGNDKITFDDRLDDETSVEVVNSRGRTRELSAAGISYDPSNDPAVP